MKNIDEYVREFIKFFCEILDRLTGKVERGEEIGLLQATRLIEDKLCSIIKDCRPRVSKDFIKKKVDRFFFENANKTKPTIMDYELVEFVLKEIGVEVEE